MSISLRVVKVGGSLFDWPMLPQSLNTWLGKQSLATNVLIAGGGKLADSIREASRNFLLEEEVAHWLAIDAMSIHSRLIVALLLNAEFISTYWNLRSAIDVPSTQYIAFDPNQFLREEEVQLSGHVLPHDWSVTSDSIAARVAEVLGADELVLLKSTDPPANNQTTASLADSGFVDCYFPAFDSCGFRRRFVNLRSGPNCPAASKVEPFQRGCGR